MLLSRMLRTIILVTKDGSNYVGEVTEFSVGDAGDTGL